MPALRYDDVERALGWLEDAFGLHEHLRWTSPEGVVRHAEMMLGDAFVELAQSSDDQPSPLTLGATSSVIIAMVEDVAISGSLVTNDFSNGGPAQTFTGGYFALPTNIGDRSRTAFAVVPEVQLKVGYRIMPSASVYLSYSFLYASDVARPGNQINRNINQTQSVSYTGAPSPTLIGPGQPSFGFNRSDFWAQGVGLGLEVRF